MAVALMAVPVTPASADWLGAEHSLTSGEVIRQWPEVSGDRVVYVDRGDERAAGDVATFDIRLLDLSTGLDRLLTPGHTATGRASISGDRVVWPDLADGRPGLAVANLSTGTTRRLAARPGDHVSLSGDRLCYEYAGRVRVHDLRTGVDVAVSPARALASNCDISGGVVVWQDDRDGNLDVFARDLTTGAETRLTDDPSDQSMPRVDGDVVVWQDAAAGPTDSDIVAVDLRTGAATRVSRYQGPQWQPDVSGGLVVWMDERFGHGNTEVFAYDLASGIETRVTTADGWSGNPRISGSRIVYEDVSGGAHNLYQRVLTPPQLGITVSGGSESGVVGVAGTLVGGNDVPVVGASVLLETSPDGMAWKQLASVATAGDGSYSFVAPELRGAGWIRVRAPGSPEYPEAISRVFLLRGAGIVANPPR